MFRTVTKHMPVLPVKSWVFHLSKYIILLLLSQVNALYVCEERKKEEAAPMFELRVIPMIPSKYFPAWL